MIKIIGPKDKRTADTINTTSSSKNWSRELSPFFLGPIKLYQGFQAKNLENSWQFCKCYPEHVDLNKNPTQDYWNWAKKGWANSFAERYPMGKGKIPLFSFWDGKKLSYIEARKEIYIPLYRDAVRNTDAYRRLNELYQSKGQIILFDFDGYDYRSLNMSLKDVLNNPNKKMGHAFVLAMMLTYGPNFSIDDVT